MLAALLLLGLLPFAALPLFENETGSSGSDPEPDDDAPGTTAPSTDETGDLLDELDEPEPEPDPDPEGEIYEFAAEPGETTLYAFEPGIDSVGIDLSGLDGEVLFDTAEDETGATLSLSLGDGEVLTLHFEGLSHVPAGDIALTLSEDGGGMPYTLSLSDAFEVLDEDDRLLDVPESDPPGVLDPVDPVDPVDPDEPDEPGPVGDDPVLDPVDPDEPDQPGPVEVGVVLDPVDPQDLPVPDDMALADLVARDGTGAHGLSEALTALAESGVRDSVLTEGDDTATLNGGAPGSLTISEGTPVLQAGGAIDVVDAGDGNDSVTVAGGAAYVFGGAGDDILTAQAGGAALYGGAGADSLDAGAAGEAVFMDGGTGDDVLIGGSGGDLLEGGEHAPGLAGNDRIDGGAGDDTIRGGLGADTLLGGDGADFIDHIGLAEEDEIAEHAEFAWHVDGADADSLSGGDGDDTLVFGDGDAADGGAGSDLFWIYSTGAAPAEIADFTVGDDFLRVSLNPEIGENGTPSVEVAPSADGLDAAVTVNGDVVAILRGAPGATVSDIYAEVARDVFPAG